MHEETFEHIVEGGIVLVGVIVLVTPGLVHWRLRHGLPVNTGIWRLTRLHQPDRQGRSAPFRACGGWHVGWAHGVWWLYFIAVALVWVVLRLFGEIRH